MATVTQGDLPQWEQMLLSRLPVYGHRNWIVVADSAYPQQSAPGIETIRAGDTQIVVLRRVLAAIAASRHVKASVYTDQELGYVQEADAPGVAEYRAQLADSLPSGGCELLHEAIIAKLDQAAKMFRVLIVKTDMVIPYTSVFFELDCAYWNAAADKRLRSAIRSAAAK